MTRLRPTAIILFWLPLAATWLMMAVEGPYIAAIVARMPAAAHSLAAYGVATALAWLIESPIMMLLSAATALVHGRASYLALRRFAFLLNALVTAGMVLLALPPVFRFVGETLIGLPPEISRLAHLATIIMIPWPAAIGYRRFYQGILVKHHLTRRVAYGTVVRLATMSVTALLAYGAKLPGAVLGACALLAGVVAEAAASRWMAHALVGELLTRDEPHEGSLLTMPDIARFYFPLALTSMLSMALGPLVTFGLGRGRAPIESLAVWPVVQGTAFIFRSGGIAFQEVGIALRGREVARTGIILGGLASLSLALLAFTPLEAVWFRRVSGLSEHLASFALLPIRILVLLPLLDFVLSVQRADWIVARRTRVVTIATAIEGAGLALLLFATIGQLSMVGATGGAIAMIAGRLAANGYLFGVRRRLVAALPSLRTTRSE
ncbi:MAG: hypothetical protein ACXW5U_15475 [Thermoanaerobaculia bacterium]